MYRVHGHGQLLIEFEALLHPAASGPDDVLTHSWGCLLCPPPAFTTNSAAVSDADADLCGHSTMVWAVGLNDSTLIEALGSNLNRPKAEIYEPRILECSLGTGLHDELGC
jgi:hypothetical protein